ncbi:hypothetical protein BH10PSE7_BH10PSE7_29890 [soil metagenome]
MRNLLLTSVTLFVFCSAAHADDILLQEFRYNPKKEGDDVRIVFNTATEPEARYAVGAVAGALGANPAAVVVATSYMTIINQRTEQSGINYWGYFRHPDGYTICNAELINPSANCGNTFNAAMRRDPDGGLHYYLVLNDPGFAQGRCWVDGTIRLTYIKDALWPQYKDKCPPDKSSGYCTWLIGPGGKAGRHIPCE